jgi:hypothetical protein
MKPDEGWTPGAVLRATGQKTLGKRARVVAGRGTPVGAEGIIFWIGRGDGGGRLRVGLRNETRQFFCGADEARLLKGAS